jgi:hypothetical protein
MMSSRILSLTFTNKILVICRKTVPLETSFEYKYFIFSFMLWNASMTCIIVNHTFQLGTSYNQVSRCSKLRGLVTVTIFLSFSLCNRFYSLHKWILYAVDPCIFCIIQWWHMNVRHRHCIHIFRSSSAISNALFMSSFHYLTYQCHVSNIDGSFVSSFMH